MIDQIADFFVFIVSWFVDLFKLIFKRGTK